MDDLYLKHAHYGALIEQGDLARLKSALVANGDFSGVSVDLLSVAVIEGKLDIVKWVLNEGVDPNDSDPYDDGYSALWWAVLNRNKELIEILVEFGATVTGKFTPDFGDTALHLAVRHGDNELVDYLLDKAQGKGAFQMFDSCDWSPLHTAVNEGRLETAKLLLKRGHDPNALVQVLRDDKIGYTPIADAVSRGNVQMTRLLLECGADPDRPGFMWTSARDQLDKLEEPARSRIQKLLEIRPLKKLKDSDHLEEVERQLLEDLRAQGYPELTLSWRGSRAFGRTVQVRGERLARFQNIRLCDRDGKVVGRGEFGFLVLTVELEFRVFWTELKIGDEVLQPGKGTIPGHVWNALSEEQRSWLVMDTRNEWRAEQPGRLLVDGEPVR